MNLINRTVNEEWDEEIQAFHENLERVENNALLAGVISLSQDAVYYRRNPFRLVPYLLLSVTRSEEFDEENHYHDAFYVLERTGLANVERKAVLFRITVTPSDEEGTPSVDVSTMTSFDEQDIPTPPGTTLLEKAYSPEGEAVLEARRQARRDAL